MSTSSIISFVDAAKRLNLDPQSLRNELITGGSYKPVILLENKTVEIIDLAAAKEYQQLEALLIKELFSYNNYPTHAKVLENNSKTIELKRKLSGLSRGRLSKRIIQNVIAAFYFDWNTEFDGPIVGSLSLKLCQLYSDHNELETDWLHNHTVTLSRNSICKFSGWSCALIGEPQNTQLELTQTFSPREALPSRDSGYKRLEYRFPVQFFESDVQRSEIKSSKSKRGSSNLDALVYKIFKGLQSGSLPAEDKRVWLKLFAMFTHDSESVTPIVGMKRVERDNPNTWQIFYETDTNPKKSMKWSAFKDRCKKIRKSAQTG